MCHVSSIKCMDDRRLPSDIYGDNMLTRASLALLNTTETDRRIQESKQGRQRDNTDRPRQRQTWKKTATKSEQERPGERKTHRQTWRETYTGQARGTGRERETESEQDSETETQRERWRSRGRDWGTERERRRSIYRPGSSTTVRENRGSIQPLGCH